MVDNIDITLNEVGPQYTFEFQLNPRGPKGATGDPGSNGIDAVIPSSYQLFPDGAGTTGDIAVSLTGFANDKYTAIVLVGGGGVVTLTDLPPYERGPWELIVLQVGGGPITVTDGALLNIPVPSEASQNAFIFSVPYMGGESWTASPQLDLAVIDQMQNGVSGSVAPTSFRLRSPDSTVWLLFVSDLGTLSTTVE